MKWHARQPPATDNDYSLVFPLRTYVRIRLPAAQAHVKHNRASCHYDGVRKLLRYRASGGVKPPGFFGPLHQALVASSSATAVFDNLRSKMIGSASCQLMESVPFVDFTKLRLEALLAAAT